LCQLPWGSRLLQQEADMGSAYLWPPQNPSCVLPSCLQPLLKSSFLTCCSENFLKSRTCWGVLG
jgi:hypothetical protein